MRFLHNEIYSLYRERTIPRLFSRLGVTFEYGSMPTKPHPKASAARRESFHTYPYRR